MSSPKLLQRMSKIKHKIFVLSGKGGVGKSTVATQLALTLANHFNLKVGILDVDICGPSVPKILGIEGKEVFQCDEGWVPVPVDAQKKLCCMSIAFLLGSPDDAVVWRGPKKHAMIRQFLEDVFWSELDVLIVDTPPGTSDEHITLAELLKLNAADGAVIVTTPQGVSVSDVKKEINFCHKLNIPVLGVVENMSGFACPCCHEITYIFSQGGGMQLAQQYQVPFLGAIPIDPKLGECEEQGKDYVTLFSQSTSAIKLKDIAQHILKQINKTIQ